MKRGKYTKKHVSRQFLWSHTPFRAQGIPGLSQQRPHLRTFSCLGFPIGAWAGILLFCKSSPAPTDTVADLSVHLSCVVQGEPVVRQRQQQRVGRVAGTDNSVEALVLSLDAVSTLPEPKHLNLDRPEAMIGRDDGFTASHAPHWIRGLVGN
jgi:hypothetical protein